jgi:RimJ/RimL family protein N-acetyltransferase
LLEVTPMDTEIRSERLLLRRPRAADAGPMTLWAGQYKVASMLSRVPHPYPRGAAEAFIERANAGKPGDAVYAIDGSPSGAADFLGMISLKGEGATRGLGYWVGPPAWGLGYATEAAATVLDHAFATGVARVETKVFADNVASVRVLEKLGFARTGEGEGHCPARNDVVPEHHMALDRADWAGAAAVLREAAPLEASAAELRGAAT